MTIRYNQKLNASINSIVRNYNAKIKRLEKVSEELYLPEVTSVSSIKSSITNRKELMRMLKDLQLYSERGMEKTVRFSSGLEMSKYESEKLKRAVRAAKIKATKAINSFKSVPIKVFGVSQTTPHEFDEVYLNLKKQRENLDKSIENLNKRQIMRLKADVESILFDEERNEVYKDNWLDMLEKLSYYSSIDKGKIEEVIKRVKKLSPSNFTKLYRNEKSIKGIQERYQDAIRNKFHLDEEYINDLDSILNNFTNNIEVILEDYE